MKVFKPHSGIKKAGLLVFTIPLLLSGLFLGVVAAVDSTPPTDPAVFDSPSHTIWGWSNDPTINLDWIGGTDTSSGVAGYSWSWSPGTIALPDTTVDTASIDFSRPTIAAGFYHTVGLKSDGTVAAVGIGSQTTGTASWSDIVAIAAGDSHTVGLKSDGTVVAAGSNTYGQTDVSGWTDIVAVSAGGSYSAGVKSDGTVVAAGFNFYGQITEAASWTDIIALDGAENHIAGLKADGTVVAAGYNDSRLNVSGWTDIVAIAAGDAYSVGLKSDGTVVAVGAGSGTNVSGWTDIVAVSAGYGHTVGLKSDGTVVAAGYNTYGQTNVSGWTDIVAVSAGEEHTVGLKSDGTVVAVGQNGGGQTNVSGWTDIRQPSYRAAYNAPDGEWWFNLRTVDRDGNWTSTVHYGPFLVDTINTAGTVKINGGAAYAKSTGVTLNLTRPGGGSVQDEVRFKNDGGNWSDWQEYAASIGWTLTSANGSKKVWAQIRDMAGNISSAYSDTIVLDTQKPAATMVTPYVSTRISKTTTFKVKWSAEDASPSSGLNSYKVRYRPSGSRTWRTWKSNTTSTYGYFTGKQGVTYYFRTRAVDSAGNYGWSKVYKTIAPFNEGMSVLRRIGFYGYQKSAKSQNYLSSIRYSYKRGHTIVYKLHRTNGIGLITTKGPNRGRAKIYVDGKYIKTVDAHKSSTKARQLIYYKGFAKKGTHYLKIVNLGTPGRARFDLDGIVVGR